MEIHSILANLICETVGKNYRLSVSWSRWAAGNFLQSSISPCFCPWAERSSSHLSNSSGTNPWQSMEGIYDHSHCFFTAISSFLASWPSLCTQLVLLCYSSHVTPLFHTSTPLTTWTLVHAHHIIVNPLHAPFPWKDLITWYLRALLPSVLTRPPHSVRSPDLHPPLQAPKTAC